MATRHDVRWVTAAPRWRPLVERPDPAAMREPALLRFTSDDFLDDFAALLAQPEAARQGAFAARIADAVSYRARLPGERAAATRPLDQLKLYQPVHGQFHLVTACLVCEVPGLPDFAVDRARGDRVGFVLRRLAADGVQELAWIKGGGFGAGATGTWNAVGANPKRLVAGEEFLPLFPVPYAEGSRTRRLFAGLIPTSSRDAFARAPVAKTAAAPLDVVEVPLDQRVRDALETRVLGPLEELAEAATAKKLSDAEQEAASRAALLDFADLLETELPRTWTALEKEGKVDLSAGAEVLGLFKLLEETEFKTAKGSFNLLGAVRGASKSRREFFAGTATLDAVGMNLFDSRLLARDSGDREKLLDALGAAVLAEAGAPGDKREPATAAVPKIDPSGGTRYLLRCVFAGHPCGPRTLEVVSEPSAAFSIASYFDPDAPARPIRISLPVDTSPTGLRQHQKGVAMVISQQLRNQMQRAKDLKALLAKDVGPEGSFDLGEICSFSIPIITICAFILLMIMVQLLNIVFYWLPFLRVCLPLKLAPPPAPPTGS